MNHRHKIEVGVLLLGPVACGIAFYLFFRDSYLSIVLANLVLFIVLRFLDFKAFLFVESLQNLWREQRGATRKIVFDPATCVTVGNAVVVETAPEVILGEENIAKLARLKSLLGETRVFIPEIQDECVRILWLNFVLALFLLIITPAKALDTHHTTTPAQQLPSNGAPKHPMANESSIGESGEARTGLAESFLRLASSFFAAALQMVWIGRMLFHYRQRNRTYYYQNAATNH